MGGCTHDCSHCAENCADRDKPQIERTHELSKIKKVIAVMSGKGGVGKSLVTALLAVQMSRKGKQCAVLDADITGPSIPRMFGVTGGVDGDGTGIYPRETKTGIRVISSNLLLPTETDPVIWRGPVISGMVRQFWTDVIWGEVDYMFIDMPPGTGDVPLTVFQSIKVDGIVIVTSPQELVSMIVTKAVKMARMMNIPVLGLVENLSYFECPDNGKQYKVFGESHIEETAAEHDLPILARLPIDTRISVACDRGLIELFEGNWLDEFAKSLLNEEEDQKMDQKLRIAVAAEGKNVTEHFGHCVHFLIFDAENGNIVSEEVLPNPGHRPGFLPNYLADYGVQVIVAGGMGGGAVDIFNERGVEVVTGASGDAQTAVQKYLKGELRSTGSVCHEHQHHDECGE